MLRRIVTRLVLPALILFGSIGIVKNPEWTAHFGIQPTNVILTAQCLIWIICALLAGRLFNYFWNRVSIKRGDGAVPGVAQYLIYALFYLVAFGGIWSGVFRQPISGILAASGFVGLIMGFALRSLIMDLFVGLTVNFDQPYRIGDFILINKERIDGQVIDISWRTTRLKTGENNVIVIPNNLMSTMVITNFSRPSTQSEMEIMFTFDFSVPIREVKRILQTSAVALLDTKGFLRHEEPKVRIKGVNAMGIEYKVKYWIDAAEIGPGKSKDRVMESIITNLQKSGISPAYPKEDSYYAPMPAKVVDYRSEKGRLALLGQIDALEQLETEYLEMIASRMTLRYFEPGDTLFQEGDPGDSMYLVVVGVLKVQVNRNGADLNIAQITPGQFFGEMSMLTGEPRTATIRAATDVIAYEIQRQHLSEVFEKQPKTVELISTVIAQRQLSNDKVMSQLSETEKKSEVESLAKQLWRRIMTFNGLNQH
ncbi:MAG: mechanosensitive ion channel family protein [Solirubrobacterales bacterium]